MWTILFFILICTQSGHAVILDRDQLKTWIPTYLTTTQFDLDSRQITYISNGTFTGLSHLKGLSLQNNTLTLLDASIFNGLSQLQLLYLISNKFTSLDRFIFNAD